MEPELLPEAGGNGENPPPGPSPVELEASALGWVPKEKFRGDEARWVDAETFVERGHTVMPILRKNNAELLTKLSAQTQMANALKADVQELRQTISQLTTFQAAEVKRQVDLQVAGLKAQRLAAIEAGDRVAEATITDQLDEARERQSTLSRAPAPSPKPPVPAPPPAEPWASEFAAENDDWLGPGKDKKKTALFVAIAEEISEKTGMRGRPLLDAAKKEMEETITPARKPGKLEGATGGTGGGGGGGGNGKSYSDLPPEAKAQAIADEKKFVGQNRAFKTQAEWRKHYADVYFSS